MNVFSVRFVAFTNLPGEIQLFINWFHCVLLWIFANSMNILLEIYYFKVLFFAFSVIWAKGNFQEKIQLIRLSDSEDIIRLCYPIFSYSQKRPRFIEISNGLRLTYANFKSNLFVSSWIIQFLLYVLLIYCNNFAHFSTTFNSLEIQEFFCCSFRFCMNSILPKLYSSKNEWQINS